MIDQPSIAILIDCWDTPATNIRKMHSNIIQFLDNTPAIETVVLATYNAQSESDCSSTIWYKNYYKQFNQKLKKNINPYGYKIENTDLTILNYINTEKFQIAMRYQWELEDYLGHTNPRIKNIYVFGSAWEICVKIRPLGYDSLSKLIKPKLNILTELNCVLNVEGNQPVPESPWSHIKDNIYYLNS